LKKPLISVIIPVYNCEKYIAICINSILCQSYRNFELIVINDGSSDKSLEIINSFNDKRISVINKKNEGVSKARNIGIDLSSGDYLYFVDSDDYLDINILNSFVDILNKYNPDLIMCGFYSEVGNEKPDIFNYKEKYYGTKREFKKDIVSLYDKHLLYNVWNKLFKKQLIIDNNLEFENIYYVEDNLFCQNYLKCCNSFYNINNCLYHYIRERENSITTGYVHNMYNIRVWENQLFCDFFTSFGLKYDEYSDFISKRFIERTIGCLENIHRKNELSFIDKYDATDDIIHNNETVKYLRIYKTNNKKISIILKFYKFKSPLFCYFIGKFMYLFKRLFPGVFNNLKNNR